MHHDPFATITSADLESVTGGFDWSVIAHKGKSKGSGSSSSLLSMMNTAGSGGTGGGGGGKGSKLVSANGTLGS